MGAGYHGGFGKTHGQKEWDNLIASLASYKPNVAEIVGEDENTEDAANLFDMATAESVASASSATDTSDSADSDEDATTSTKGISQDPYRHLPGPCDEMYIKQLENEQAHFTKDEIIFITKDKTDQIVWLEKGKGKHTVINKAGKEEERDSTGLTHIIERHATDLNKEFNIAAAEIASFIKDVASTWELVYSVLTTSNGVDAYQRLYEKDGKYYAINAVAQNGFIKSFYPVHSYEVPTLINKAHDKYTEQNNRGVKYIAYNVI